MARGRGLRAFVRDLTLAILAFASSLACATGIGTAAAPDNAGQRIYRDGVLPSGQPLRATREGGQQLEGAAAACTNCHRRSGLGMTEARRVIPPIAGSYLFHPRGASADTLDLPFVEGMHADRDPYTDATLARAIRDGVAADGSALSFLMPRYTLDDASMAQLITHLKQLSPGAVPGVTGELLHFATIVTPDADPIERRGVLDVMNKFFEDKNHYVRAASPRMRSSQRVRFKVNRPWQLHVWELTGAPDTWEAQLRERLKREPVFAVISGVGGANWAPVHRFCEAAALPCLFPNVDVPVVAEHDFDTLYLSKGVLLEAQLIAHELTALRQRQSVSDSNVATERPAARRLVQIYRAGDAGPAAAAALAGAFGASLPSVNRELLPGTRALTRALGEIKADDVVVLWLRPDDIAALGARPSGFGRVYLSGVMGGLERAPLPATWRDVTHMTYPVELPEKRVVGIDNALGWFRIRQVPVVTEKAQVDTYLACGIVSDTINHMVDTFVRDYLVERIEGMLEHRVVTGYYPHLALAQNQRFGSKGGYIVKFAAPTGTRVVAETPWIVP